ncbi:hypothetical protein [Phormidium tenue]|jgi:hypothetical protein|uniref:CpcD n=1 Tax=Phormidium tenue FACHB-1050 TaxID=2692857 RepID=A0ABR8CEL6_9CYAN|nr:hypothetical protein [Phormidium tenue]MBD2317969.1 hypothetical protein [Phormidium tenue FACHB-1050]
MKVIMTAIAALGSMTTFGGSAFADVSISIRFGSSPSVNTYRTYDSYRSNVRQPVYHNSYNQNYYNRDYYRPNTRSRVIVREVVPNYGRAWNYSTIPRNYPTSTQSVYNPYNVDLDGSRYIIEKRYIRVR